MGGVNRREFIKASAALAVFPPPPMFVPYDFNYMLFDKGCQLGVAARILTPAGVKRHAVRCGGLSGGYYHSVKDAIAENPLVADRAKSALNDWAEWERIKWAA